MKNIMLMIRAMKKMKIYADRNFLRFFFGSLILVSLFTTPAFAQPVVIAESDAVAVPQLHAVPTKRAANDNHPVAPPPQADNLNPS
ncbi:MAG: hypothetical protein PHX39_11395, partial [Bacteroidales bacterium]|nr:hypothetical protein [Bacteroidales bacterium]